MASQLRRSGWALLHVALALAIALLTLPVFGSGASAEEVAPVEETTAQNTTTQETTTGAEQTDPAPASEEPAPPAEEPATVAEEPAPAPEVATAVEDPAPEPEGVEIVGSPAGKSSPGKDAAPVPSALVEAAGVAGVCDTNSGTGKVDAFLQNTKPDRSGEWANGNMNAVKADLAEGEVVPQRVDLINLQPGENELVFTYDVYLTDKGVKLWAYDYVVNHSMTNGVTVTGWTVKNGDGPLATVEVTFDVPAGVTS